MANLNKQKWDDLNLSRDEIKNIGEALQKEEFRSLLVEYVKEINDPENRKQYEKEITQLENERGVDIKFIHPCSGYVVKTSVDGKSKAFINICSNGNVGKPSSTVDVDGGHQGLRWAIPYCLAPPREDVDKRNNVCAVYDVVFHPDTLHLTKNNTAFKKLVDDTALEAVEENFHVSLDKVNLKFPKMQFKGIKHPTVIRKKAQHFQPGEFIDMPNYPYPPVKEDIQPESRSSESRSKRNVNLNISDKCTTYTTPTYILKHRNNVDMQDYTNDRMSKISITVPNELVIEVYLPLLKCSTDASIDVKENSLVCLSENPVKYKLNLKLPYIVDSNRGTAKFDTVKKVLIVTLPVVKQQLCHNNDTAREDSGVESDICYGRNSMSSGDEDGIGNESSQNKIETYKDMPVSMSMCSNTARKFLKSNVHYILPNFVCQLLRDTLSFTINVANVNPESIEYCFLDNSSGFHMTFLSMGTGFFPVNYAMCLLLPHPSQIENETFNVEVWDNNVIAQVKLISCEVQLSSYYIGSDQSNVKKFIISSPILKHTKKDKNAEVKLEEVEAKENVNPREGYFNSSRFKDNDNPFFPVSEELTPKNKDGIPTSQAGQFESKKKKESEISSEIKSEENEVVDKSSEEDKDPSVSDSSSFDESTSSPHRQSSKSRTVSESHQGEIMRSKNRGILKIGRSLSESSVDDYASWSLEKIEKAKKTVRFSEVISKQTFRMNSSILGQRKKNQRKMRNKKRAQERRFSESGGESEGEGEMAITKGNNSDNKKEVDFRLNELESSSCDVSEVSEVSDISESDDGQVEEGKPFMPCSNRKNHKRRGKKSARKNAATAKLQFMEN